MAYFAKSLDSLLRQEFGDFEVLVLDDGSSDGLAGFVASIEDPRIVYHRLESVGVASALNFGLSNARSWLIARMDADDLAAPNRLALQIEYMDRNRDCVLCSSRYEAIDAAGAKIWDGDPPLSDRALRWSLLFETSFLHPGAMYRREPVLSIGGYHGEFDVAEDYDLWTRLARHGRLANLSERLILYRVHSHSITLTKRERQRSQSKQIAGRYAASIRPEWDTMLSMNLHSFLSYGIEPPIDSMPAVVHLFDQFAEHFGDRNPSIHDELSQAIRDSRRRLRWRCLHVAEKNRFNVLLALRWLRMGRLVDPEGPTIASWLYRKIRPPTIKAAPL